MADRVADNVLDRYDAWTEGNAVQLPTMRELADHAHYLRRRLGEAEARINELELALNDVARRDY